MNSRFSSINDLLADESFLRFCARANEADVAWWEAYIKAHPASAPTIKAAQEEWRQLVKGLAQADMQDQLAALRLLVEGPQQEHGSPQPVWRQGSNEARPRQPAGPVTARQAHKLRRPARARYAAAAAVIVMAGAALWALRKTSAPAAPAARQAERPGQYSSRAGERRQLQLPDGSRIVLNAGSKLLLGEGFGEKQRDVYLDGEAYFDVKHDAQRPFTVHMKDTRIHVLGTAFNARSYGEEPFTETTLLSGAVEVALIRERRTIRLQPRQKLLYREPRPQEKAAPAQERQVALAPLTFDPKDSTVAEVAWTENKLVFFNEPMEQLAKRLERWYGVEIRIGDADLLQLRFSGAFEKEDLPKVLQVLQLTRPFRYRQEAGNVIVLYK